MSIPRSAKDILVKHLVGAFPEDALDVLGLSGIHVVKAMPTELDIVDIRQGFTDVVFELNDKDIFHIEFQSRRETSLHRFLLYDVQLSMKFQSKVRTVIFYIGDVHVAPEQLDIGTAQYHVENVYLKQLDGDVALDTVERHLTAGDWSAQDRIRLAFALHMHFQKRTSDEAFAATINLIQRIPDKHEQSYVTALIVGLTNQQLSETQKAHLMEVLKMTDLLREFEEQNRQDERMEIAKRMLAKGSNIPDVIELTGLPKEDVEKIKKSLN